MGPEPGGFIMTSRGVNDHMTTPPLGETGHPVYFHYQSTD